MLGSSRITQACFLSAEDPGAIAGTRLARFKFWRIGQEAGSCTRTVRFTHGDAADYTTILKLEPPVGLAPTYGNLQDSSCSC
jgi:hypothetical protein